MGESAGWVSLMGEWASLQALTLRPKPRPPKRRCARVRLVQLPPLLQLLLGLPGRTAPALPAGLPVSYVSCGCTRRALNAAVILRHTVGLPAFLACASVNDSNKTVSFI